MSPASGLSKPMTGETSPSAAQPDSTVLQPALGISQCRALDLTRHPELTLSRYGPPFADPRDLVPSISGRGLIPSRTPTLLRTGRQSHRRPGPRGSLSENGDFLVKGCARYRALFARPGFCWCGLQRSEHANEAPKIASEYLIHQRNHSKSRTAEQN